MPIKFRDPNNTRSVELGAAHENHDHAPSDRDWETCIHFSF